MASTADLIRTSATQAAAGAAISSDTIDKSGGSDVSPASPDSELEVRAENSTVEDLPGESGDTQVADSKGPADAEAKAPKQESTQKTSDSKEVITVTDESGRKRKVEIDYSNREATKQAHLLAAGARKWQAERDQAIQREKQVTTESAELRNNFNSLESAWKERGVEGIVDLLEGRQGAYKDHIGKQIERAEFMKTASPREIEALQSREEADRTRRELDKLRKDNETFKKQVTEEKDAAELHALEARVTPVFDKYRFADKLGNPDDEQMFDEMLWNTAMKRLEPYEEKGLSITPELLDQEFSAVSNALKRRINANAEKKATKVVEQKKREATENVQAKVMSGYKSEGVSKEANDLINSGNLTSVLKNWKKFGGVFNR